MVFRNGIRTLLWFVIFSSGWGFARGGNTLEILTARFDEQPPEIQLKVLRQVALLGSEEAIPFLAGTALEEEFSTDVRREALKGMIAVDSQFYRPVLSPLKSNTIQTLDVIVAFRQIGDRRFVKPLVELAARKKLDQRVLRVAVSGAMRLWDGNDSALFSRWKETEASEQLVLLLREFRGKGRTRVVRALAQVRDQKTTQALIKLLHDSDPAISEIAIRSLGEPGHDATSALGRFLQTSQASSQKNLAIQSLGKFGGPSAERALKAYLPQATKEEREKIHSILTR